MTFRYIHTVILHSATRYLIAVAPLLFFPLIVAAQGITPQPLKVPLDAYGPKPVAGKILVKITPPSFHSGIAEDFFGTTGQRFGVSSISPWLNPELVQFRAPGPMRKTSDVNTHHEAPTLGLLRIMVVAYTSLDNPYEVARSLALLPGVEYAEPIFPRHIAHQPNDPKVQDNTLWYLNRTEAYAAWDVVKADSSIIIAIVDTGIERAHNDLREAIWYNPGEDGDKRNNGIDDDGNGLKDDWWGYDFGGTNGYNPDNDPSVASETHGTHVAGTAAATGDNDIGIAGVAYGAKLMAVKISDDGNDPDLPGGFQGILYAAKMGARIINCSWGGSGHSRGEQEVIDAARLDYNALVVAAAGNENNEIPFYPASYTGVVSVASVNEFDNKHGASSYGYRINISAPGTSVYSTVRNNGYAYDTGTSMAAPQVSGGAALLLTQDPSRTWEQLAEILRASSQDISVQIGLPLVGKMGDGRLDLLNAVTLPQSFSSARLMTYVIEDDGGDGVADAGETITVRATIKNILAASSSVDVGLSILSPAGVSVTSNQVGLGAMGADESQTTPAGTFRFTIPLDAATDGTFTLQFTTATPTRTNTDVVLLHVNPTYATTNLNRVVATFNSVGNIGFNGLNRNQGEGISYAGSPNLLFHGGLMIGTAANRLADVVRKGRISDGTGNGFVIDAPYRLQTTPDSSVQTGTARFTDRNSVLDIDVQMTTYEFGEGELENCVIAIYDVTNTGSAPLEGLYCGLYLDWDISVNGTNDQASYDSERRLGFIENRSDVYSYYIGASLLSGQTVNFYPANNFNEAIPTDFNNLLKWKMLASGIFRETSEVTDVSIVIGGGPADIAPNATHRFAFALLGGENKNRLQISKDRVQAWYDMISDAPLTPQPFAIDVRTEPNPIGPEGAITFRLPVTGNVTLAVRDMQGRIVDNIFEGLLEEGEYRFPIRTTGWAQGVYFYELATDAVTQRGKLLIVK